MNNDKIDIESTQPPLEYFKGDDLAANVWLDKYAADGEINPDAMHKRMAAEFFRVDEIHEKLERHLDVRRSKDLSLYGRSRNELTFNSIYGLFKDFKYIVPQGSIMATLGTPIIASLSNCWVTESPYDSYGGILKTDSDLAYYYKRRGGVGVDISNLRPEGTLTKNTAKATTGAVSFMHRFSSTTREVAMEGRRGALMLSISINHPDVMEFIKIKRDGTSVTGANISIRLNDKFMKSVENDEDYILQFPCDGQLDLATPIETLEYGKLTTIDYGEVEGEDGDNYSFKGYVKRIKAKEYWNEIINSAKNHAEPGLMYWDTVINNDPAAVYPQFTPKSSNPCGEQFLNPYDSCRLMALNLLSFVNKPYTDGAEIDFDKLYEVCYEHTRLGDGLVDLELEYILRIIEKIKSDPEPDYIKRDEMELWEKSYNNTKAGRRVGLGITALADMIASLNLAYDSDDGIAIIDKVMAAKMRAELDCSIDLSILREPFEGWDNEMEFPTIDGVIVPGNKFYNTLLNEFPEQVARMQLFGRRNVSWSTIAPTGTVSLMTQTSSGCEPLFQPYYMRRKKINPSQKGVRVDFVDDIGDSWQEFAVIHEQFRKWIRTSHFFYDDDDFNNTINKKGVLEDYFKASPWFKSTANDIDWNKRNQIQSVLQKYTTNAISSTINLPSTVTESEVSDIYLSGWKYGLKGQTVYVDGSRSGVLVSNDEKNPNGVFKQMDAIKRPTSLMCDVHTTTSAGKKYNVFIGLLDGKPYETFITSFITTENQLELKKIKRGRYDLLKDDVLIYESITMDMTDEQEAITRLVSTNLRHGVDIKFIVEQLNKTSSENMFTFIKSLSRVLKKYIPDGSKSTVTCNDCGSDNVIFEEGCNKCLDCGSSKCG